MFTPVVLGLVAACCAPSAELRSLPPPPPPTSGPALSRTILEDVRPSAGCACACSFPLRRPLRLLPPVPTSLPLKMTVPADTGTGAEAEADADALSDSPEGAVLLSLPGILEEAADEEGTFDLLVALSWYRLLLLLLLVLAPLLASVGASRSFSLAPAEESIRGRRVEVAPAASEFAVPLPLALAASFCPLWRRKSRLIGEGLP